MNNIVIAKAILSFQKYLELYNEAPDKIYNSIRKDCSKLTKYAGGMLTYNVTKVNNVISGAIKVPLELKPGVCMIEVVLDRTFPYDEKVVTDEVLKQLKTIGSIYACKYYIETMMEGYRYAFTYGVNGVRS